jgi:hypothetical protein
VSFFSFFSGFSCALTLVGTLASDVCASAPTVPPHALARASGRCYLTRGTTRPGDDTARPRACWSLSGNPSSLSNRDGRASLGHTHQYARYLISLLPN